MEKQQTTFEIYGENKAKYIAERLSSWMETFDYETESMEYDVTQAEHRFTDVISRLENNQDLDEEQEDFSDSHKEFIDSQYAQATADENEKQIALEIFLTHEEGIEEIGSLMAEDFDETNENTFEINGSEYMVLTDDEADEQAKNYILDSVWAFNSGFLIGHMADGVEEDIIKFAQEKCEDANETLKAMITDLDHFVSDAISADGRGHFLSSYDGEEHEYADDGRSVDYFIYRIN